MTGSRREVMRRRAGMYSGRMGAIVACGWRDGGLVGGILAGGGDSGDFGPLCPDTEVGRAATGGGGGGGAAPCVRVTTGGEEYEGDLGLKKFLMEDCPLPLGFVEGRDMFVASSEYVLADVS